jgi:hypothetical protein
MNNIEIIETENGPSGRMYVEKYVKKNYFEIYNEIINFCSENLDDIPFKEKVYHYVHNIKYIIYCANNECNNLVKFKNSTLGYNKYCSNKCVSSDSKIKKIKEQKSYDKYGTKAPSMNNEIKEKMIKTNQEKYGSNCPLQNMKIKQKSIKTLITNYGVDNPNKSQELIDKRVITFSNNMRNKYIELLKPHGIKDIDYKNKIAYFHCDNCNKDFELPLDLFHNRKQTKTTLCTHCNPIDSSISGQELQLQNYIKNIYNGNIILNDRNLLTPYELDVYLPDLNIAFEFNGLYWHNELYKENNYHLKKTELAENKGIKLIQIYEDDWTYKQEIIKSMIMNCLKMTINKIYARKCIIKEIDNKTTKEFLNNNHLQGNVNCKIKIGLFYNNELVSLMSFSKNRINLNQKHTDKCYELIRYCNKLNTNVIGGATKLFKYFIENHNPKNIITYADRSFSQGLLYKTLGFSFIHKTQPNYFYVVNKIRKNRFLFRKDILIKEGFNSNNTEKEIMLERKIYRIYDSGSLKFIYQIP